MVETVAANLLPTVHEHRHLGPIAAHQSRVGVDIHALQAPAAGSQQWGELPLHGLTQVAALAVVEREDPHLPPGTRTARNMGPPPRWTSTGTERPPSRRRTMRR